MTRNSVRLFIILVLALVIASIAFSQRQTGSVAGKTVDSEGVPLPGVTATLSGPALMGTLSFTTSDSGDFRFPSAPPGQDYVITFELPGFKTLKRGGIIISVGKTVSLTITMEESAIEEEVTVIAATPTIDVKSSKVAINYDSEMIENIPLRRDFYDVITSAPGIITEGTDFHRSFVSHGGTVRSNSVSVDGMSMNDPVVGTNMTGLPFDIFDEFEFELGAHPAEVGQAEGAYVNIITKSGGNKFSGMLMAYYFNDSMVKSLIPGPEAEAVGLTQPQGFKNWQDYSGTLGGPFIKDRLWFFANVRYTDRTLQAETIFEGVVELPRTEWSTYFKLTWKPTGSLQFTGFWHFKDWFSPWIQDFGVNYRSSMDSMPRVDHARDNMIQIMGSWVAGQNTFFDLRFNYFRDIDPWHTPEGLDQNIPLFIDIATNGTTGPYYNEDYTNIYGKGLASATHYADDFLGGDHEFKFGVEYQNAPFTWDVYKKNMTFQLVSNGDVWALGPGTGYILAYNLGANKGDTPIKAELWRFSAYIQDSWTIADRLTFNIGLRYDESHGNMAGGTFLPAGANDPLLSMIAPQVFKQFTIPDANDVLVWKDFSPRIGIVFDVFGDGTTSLKASWARYNELLQTQYFSSISPAYPSPFAMVWLDLDLNRNVDTTDAYIPVVFPPDPAEFDLDNYRDPNVKSPYSDEFIVGIERELFKDFSLGVIYTYKNKGRVVETIERYRGQHPDSGSWVPYTVSEPGWDGQFGTEDDADITVYGVKAGAPESRLVMANPEGAKRRYHGVDIMFQKRMSNRWQMAGSLTLSKFEGNIGAGYGWTHGLSGAFNDPNWDVNRFGRLDFDRPVQIKLSGTVLLPGDFSLSTYYFHMSGAPWGRTLMIWFPQDPSFDAANPPTTTVQAEAPGSRRFRSRNNLDLRVEKTFGIGDLGRLGIFVDLLNVLGERWFDVDEDPGGWIMPDGSFIRFPTWGQFIGANGLRTFKASIRFTF